MAYGIKYIMQFTSDRGNEIRIEVLKKDYQGEVIYKSLGGAPSLTIEQGDGAIKGSSLVFAMQADTEGELQELYTTDNKLFKVDMYRNEVLSWQGYILPELYSEEYVDAPYDVSVTATDQLATLKAITYQRGDVNVSLSTIIEDILSFTQISLPVTYHQNLSALRKGEVPMLVDSHISQAAYNGYTCYDVLANILLSCNCCIMQINGEWLVTSQTNTSTNYYTAGETVVREHRILGQLGVGEVCPSGVMTMVNNPALKGAHVEYAHMLRNSFLVNADCVDRQGWNYTPDSRNPIDIPGEKQAFGKVFKAYCWELHPVNIKADNSLQLWQEVSLNKDENNYYDLSVKCLFGTNAKLLLMAVTHLGSDGVERRLTSEGWIEKWDKSDINYYIQITGTVKSAGLESIADIGQYEMSTVQFKLPSIDGTLRVGFINSTTDYAEPFAYAPIYVSQVYLTVSNVTGQECTTEVEPNATQLQQDVLLAYGDTSVSTNAYKLCLNTLKKSSGENITTWWLDGAMYSSYYDVMLQEFSRYYGVKKAQLQGTIMGESVLHNIYTDVFSGRVLQLLSAQVDLLSDEASVTVEEVVTSTVAFDTVIYATNNNNSFGSASGGGSVGSGGGSSTAGESLLGLQSDGDVYVKDGRALVGSEARFEKMALPSSAPDKRAEQKTYIYSSDTSRGAIDIAKIAKYIEDQEALWVLDKENSVIRTTYNVVSEQEIISGRRASGASSDVSGGGGISQVTAQMIADALGYVPYSSQNPAGYITSSALNGYAKTSDIPSLSGYATQSWVEGKKYLTAIPSEYITETELSNTLGGYQSKITSSNKLAYSLISGTPSLASVATSGKYSDLSGTPSSLPASDVYAWAKKSSLAAADVPNLDWSKITSGKPTTLAGYGITDAISTSGGTMVSGAGIFSHLDSVYGAIGFNNDHNAFGSPNVPTRIRSNVTPIYSNGTNEYAILHSGNYSSYALPLSGGTLNSDSYSPLIIDTTNNQNRVQFKVGGVDKALVGWNPNYGAWLYNYPSGSFLHIKDDGTPCYNGNTLIHSGNIGNYALKTDGSNAMSAIAYIKWNTAEGGEDYSVYGNGFRMLTYNASTGDYRGGISIGTRYGWQLVRDGYTGTLQARFRVVDTTTWEAWKTIAFTDSNVASANKLLTSSGASMVYQTSAGHLYVGDNIYPSADTHILGNNIRLRYGTSASYGLILNSSGNVLMGTTTDNGGKLQVAGGPVKVLMASSFDDAMFYGERTDLGYKIGIGVGASASRGIYDTKLGWCFKIDTGNNLSIVGHTVTGNLTATGEVISTRRATSSDARLKDNINRLLAEDCLAMVRNLQPSSWDWKENGEHSMGFIAQDVEQYMPYAVTRIKDDKLGEKLNLQYDQFFAPVVGAIQCLDSEVEQLKKRVKYLEKKLQEYGNNWS